MAAGRDRLAGKTALITGGASGIGRAIAEIFVEQGATVVIADIDAERGTAVASQIGATFALLDVRDEDGWQRVTTETLDRHGRLDVLVNNAGTGGSGGSIEDASVDDWDRVMDINAKGVFLGCKYGVATMKANEAPSGGSIVNMSSIAGLVGAPAIPVYSASKGAVRLLTKSVALHCAKKGYGIRCNSVHPSYTDTPMVDRMVDGHHNPERLRQAIVAAAPLGRIGAPADVAGAVLYLASDDSAFVTGTELTVDGGICAM
ncbi:glucose 1-dehydrogenase [Thalassobaculum litoreum]|uniref:NAD(P)-dependent dehydrogenase, short-chain alcohol dehydrogenase family n=1 Tax=Thalassobaculum litoreum DSM 18839 TaxID=1123362 RepID=A0A8G2BDR6_9PROT|nr:glucose 1-dehydrogenase [Thalassobaculum litoreum]SDF05074.1 NAD(P)-dependent dehydrogenase, short-chain alcohol dehydrogenase family [Thalassobaculum litoreum DSM 18839]